MKLFTSGSAYTSSNIFYYSGADITPKTFKTNFSAKISSLLVLLFFGLCILIPSNVHAQHPYGFFDGNAINDNGKLDWDNVYTNTGLPAGSISTGVVFDGKAPDSIYTGGGTKDHLPINGANASKSWQWKTATGSSSDKTNIQEAGAVLIDGVIYFFGNRFSAEGATNIGFWLFQDDVGPINGGRFSGQHTNGDVLVVAEIVQGGSEGRIEAYKYDDITGVYTSSSKTLSDVDTDDATLNAIVNSESIPSPWPHVAKNGPANFMPAITFFEGFINIKKLIEDGELDAGANCFSTFIIETRASFSISSVLEDFVGGNFDVQPRVTLEGLTACEDDIEGATLKPEVSGGLGTLTYMWFKDGEKLDNETGSTLLVSESGTYSVIVTGDGIGGAENACPSEEVFAEVVIYPLVSAGTGENARYCEDDPDLASLDLFALLTDEDAGGVWTNESDEVVNSPINLSGFDPGVYAFKYTVTPEEGSLCPPDDETVLITIDSTVTAGTGSNDEYCEDDPDLASVDLFALLSGEDAGGVWTNEADEIVNSPINLSGFDPDDYTFKYTVSPEEGSVCPDDDESVTITIHPLPVVNILEPPSDPVCSSDVPDGIEFKGTPLGGTWSGDVDEFGVFVPDPNKIEHTIRYTFTDINGCTNYDEIKFDFEQQPQGDTFFETVCVGDPLDLSLTYSPANATNVVFSGEGVTQDGQFVGDTAKLYVVIVSYNLPNNICRLSDSIEITVEICLEQGCTLGYWKNHTDRWDCYETCTLYNSIFTGSTLSASLTLQQALNLEGNTAGENLARQSVAALLNICSSGVSYPGFGTEQALIDYVNAAFGPGAPTVNEAGNHLDFLNNSDCPLSGTNATTAPSDGCLNGASSALITSDTNLFTAYPVPFNDALNVQYDFDYSSAANIQIFDLQGRMLRSYNEANAYKGKVTSLSIDFRTQANQVYILKVTTDRDVFTKKIISDK